MTILYAYVQTDFSSVNLNFWYTHLDFDQFNDNANTYGYEDNYHLVTTTNDSLSLYGSGFAYSGADMVNGTIEGLNQWAWDNLAAAWSLSWAWTGWDIAMSDFFGVGQTATEDDDMAFIKEVMSGADTVHLSADDDYMRGFKDNDVLYGHGGDDELHGNDGKDKLFGSKGNDLLSGGRGNDRLYGARGDDTLIGGDGRDRLKGGPGYDTMTGGAGVDIFEFDTGNGTAVVTDFDTVGNRHDFLDLSGLTSIVRWSDLRDNHMAQDGGDVVIDGFFGDTVILQDVDITDLNKVDFIF